MSAIRPFVSAVVIGASVWCAAGHLTVAAPDSPILRLAVPASGWWFILPAFGALLVPAWRRRPSLAAPALLATLPWWPVPVPSVFLVWTGPMAWMPIGLALACAVFAGRGRVHPVSEPPVADPRAPVRPSAVLAGLLTLALGVAVAVLVDSRTPGGDEPHYLVITQSIIRDGDLRIENNHRDRDYAEYYGGVLAPDFIQRGADGGIYSIHAPGVSMLVAPAFALYGYRGAQATLLVLSAVTGALVWLIGWHATGRHGAAWFAWAGVALTPALLLHSGMVFPDAPGALAVAAAVWLIVRLDRAGDPVPLWAVAAVGTLLSGLPWLHTRFAVLAAGVGAVILWRLWSNRSRRVAGLIAFSVVPGAAAIAWFAFFWLIYGTPNPAAPYGGDSGARLAYVPGGMLGLLFDQQFGLLAYSPVLVCGAYGLAVARRFGQRAAAWTSVIVAMIYAAAVATYWMWWAGVPATPARFMTAVVPVAALPLAMAWSAAGPRLRQMLGGMLAASLAISAVTVGVGHGSLAWNTRNAEAQWLEWLGPLVNLPRAWPSFFWRLSPDDLSTELPFLLHVVVFAGVIAAAGALALRLGRSESPGVRQPALWLVWALPVSLMAASALGWQLNGVNGLDPMRSQLHLATLAGEGLSVWRISALHVGSDRDAVQALRIHGEEPGRTDVPPPWAVLTGVPPGRYDLRVAAAGGAGRMSVKIGRSPRALSVVSLDGSGGQRVPLWLPAGAGVLLVDEDPTASGTGGAVELHPLMFERPLTNLAQSFERYGPVDVFFLDSGVYVEPSGFWVRGESTSDWVLAGGLDQTTQSMLVQNGGAPNDVVVTIDGVEQTLSLGPSDGRRLEIPLAGTRPAVHVRVYSPAGFRPADVGPSEDRRYLGVWIQLDGK